MNDALKHLPRHDNSERSHGIAASSSPACQKDLSYGRSDNIPIALLARFELVQTVRRMLKQQKLNDRFRHANFVKKYKHVLEAKRINREANAEPTEIERPI